MNRPTSLNYRVDNSNLINFLGFPIHTHTLEETAELIIGSIKQEKVINHIVLNAAKLVYAKDDSILKKAVLNSDIINADGQSIVWGARLLGKNIPERVTGIDLFLHLLSEFEKANISVFFLGAKKDVLRQTIENIKQGYPELNIAGYRNGYFSREEERQICEKINNSQAKALFLGISSPKKEIFLLENSSILKPYFRMGVGGSFDILAGHTKRCPKFMQKTGFEWLYRIYQEPGRMWKRYAVTNTLYLYYLMKEVLK